METRVPSPRNRHLGILRRPLILRVLTIGSAQLDRRMLDSTGVEEIARQQYSERISRIRQRLPLHMPSSLHALFRGHRTQAFDKRTIRAIRQPS